MTDNRIVFRQIDKLFIFLFFASCLNSVLGLLFYVALMVYWFYGAEGGLKALIFLTTRGILSSAVAAVPAFSTIRWFILIGSSLIIFLNTRLNGTKKSIFNAVVLCVIGFDLIAIFSCLYICSYPITSIFKLMCYTVSFLAVLMSIAATNEYIDWKNFIALFYLPLFCISLLLIPFNRFRIINNDFQGVFNHVNMFGIVASTILAFVVSASFFERYKKLKIFFVISMLIMIFLSGSRTGMFTALIIILISIIVNRKDMPKKIFFLLVIGCLVLLVVSSSSVISDSIYQFIFKHNNESLWYSRSELIATYKNHYAVSKLLGTGFLVPYTPGVIDCSLNFDLTVEPGNMLWMLMGDVGILGTASFILMLVVIFRHGSRSKSHMLLTPILICMGEMVFFNPNNMSVLLYMLIGLYLFDDYEVRRVYE